MRDPFYRDTRSLAVFYSISIPFTHTSPHFYAFTHFTLQLFCIYISSTRNSTVQFGKLPPRICSCESFSGSWEARRKGNHTVTGSSPLRLPAGCNWPIGSVMASNCMLINTFMFYFFLLSSLSFVFNYFRKKEKSRQLAGKLSVFHLRFGKTGDKKRATCIALCPTTIASYKPMLRVLPPTDKNLSFLLPVFHSFCSNVAKQVGRFCCPSP